MKYICLLRGINVGGKTLKMDGLRQLFEALGFLEVRTYIQSGNVIFDASEARPGLQEKIETALEKRFDMKVSAFICTPAELQSVIHKSPFQSSELELNRLLVTFLFEPPLKESVKTLLQFDHGSDQIVIQDQIAYLYCPSGYGKSKLSNNFLEAKLKVQATTRNWRTVTKLAEL